MDGLRQATTPSPSTAASDPSPGKGSAARSPVQVYDRCAPLYDFVFGSVLEPGRRAMARTAAALQPSALLEVGVGTGLTLAGYPAGTRVVGVDLSADMLARAR